MKVNPQNLEPFGMVSINKTALIFILSMSHQNQPYYLNLRYYFNFIEITYKFG
jgi:hypothetical protein